VQAFLFLFGALTLREIPVLSRHARNIVLFLRMKRHVGVVGCIRYDKWLTLEVSSLDLLGYAFVYLIAFLLTFSISLLGGAFALLIVAIHHKRMSTVRRRKASQDSSRAIVANDASGRQ
jgi:hypothetical protein